MRGSFQVKTPPSKSRALLNLVTLSDHLFMRLLLLIKVKRRVEDLNLRTSYEVTRSRGVRFQPLSQLSRIFGGGRIRTLGGRTSTTVLKTAALNRSATPPVIYDKNNCLNTASNTPLAVWKELFRKFTSENFAKTRFRISAAKNKFRR